VLEVEVEAQRRQVLFMHALHYHDSRIMLLVVQTGSQTMPEPVYRVLTLRVALGLLGAVWVVDHQAVPAPASNGTTH
jgi:hypothetical protein